MENNLQLLSDLGPAQSHQASSSNEPRFNISALVRAELAQKLLDDVPDFQKLFLEYNEVARWKFGERTGR